MTRVRVSETCDPQRILIFGNAGSGKTWLSQRLSEKLGVPHFCLDRHFWEPGGFTQKRDKQTVAQEIHAIARGPSWIIEGVYGDLVEIAMERSSLVLFLDKTWEECREALVSRNAESEEDESFRKLIEYAERYWARTDSISLGYHRQLFENANCEKRVFRTRNEVESFVSNFDARACV